MWLEPQAFYPAHQVPPGNDISQGLLRASEKTHSDLYTFVFLQVLNPPQEMRVNWVPLTHGSRRVRVASQGTPLNSAQRKYIFQHLE